MSKRNSQPAIGWASSLLLASTLLIFFAFAAGCGSGSSASKNPAPSPTPTPALIAGSTTAQVRIGDAAVDSIIDFEFSIGSPVVFTMSGATGAASITVGPNRFELSHMAAKMEPLDVLNVPQASYVSAQITIQNPELTFLTPLGTPVTVTGPDQTVIIPLTPPLTIGATPMVVNLDVNVANSIVAPSGTITAITFGPGSFNFSTKAVAPEAQQEDDSGEVEGLVGEVTGVLDPVFVLNLTSNSQLNFGIDSTTQFTGGLTNLDSALNHLVRVEGMTKADGILVAKEVESLETQNGSELDGLLTLVSGNPATSLKLLAQDGIGNGMDPAKIGAEFTVNVTGLPTGNYMVDLGRCDTNGIMVPSVNFPFDPATIHRGQRIEVDNSAGVPPADGSFTADRVWLEQQAINGTVANFAAGMGGAATFDLALPADSYLATLSSETSVHVFQQPGTDNRFGTITNNNLLRVRGLLFWTGTTFNMLARRITAP